MRTAGRNETAIRPKARAEWARTPRTVSAACPRPVSAAAASARLASLVAAEPPGRPLSDQALAETLQAEGYALARRTVAKYRKLLKIPATAQRRRRTRMGAGTRPPG